MSKSSLRDLSCCLPLKWRPGACHLASQSSAASLWTLAVSPPRAEPSLRSLGSSSIHLWTSKGSLFFLLLLLLVPICIAQLFFCKCLILCCQLGKRQGHFNRKVLRNPETELVSVSILGIHGSSMVILSRTLVTQNTYLSDHSSPHCIFLLLSYNII